MRILSDKVADYIGKEITISGWLHKKRLLGGLTFILVRDRKGVTQVLVEDKNEVKKLSGMQLGTVMSITGTVSEDKRAPGGAEIHEPKIEIISPVEAVSPIEIDKPIDHNPENFDTLFDNRVVNLRNLTEQGIFKIQAQICKSIREYFDEHEFTEIHTPKLNAEATEGGSEVFKLDYFGKEATLAQSPQFYKQIMVGVFERVYEIAPVFRAEPSATTRHMTEYISVDGEIGYLNDFRELLNFLSGLINKVVDDVWENHQEAVNKLQAKKPKLLPEFPMITLNDLHELYFKDTGEDTRNEKDPTPAEERWVSEYSKKKYNCEAIYVIDFPTGHDMGFKFYHRANKDNPKIADRADLIFGGIEIITTSMREHRYKKLVEQLKEMGGDPNAPGFQAILDTMKYGMPPHGGFGLGLERLTEKILGLNNIRETTLFPRDINRLTP